MSSASEQEVSSAAPPQRKWVALISIAAVLGNEDDRYKEVVIGTDVLLHLDEPPHTSFVAVRHRVSPYPRLTDDETRYAYILAADRSACILLQVVEGNHWDLFLCDTYKRAVSIIPPMSSEGLGFSPHHTIGLIADPHNRGHYEVVQLQSSTSDNQPNRLICYSTAKGYWFIRGLTLQQLARMRNPFYDTTVLAHDGRLWWFAQANGVLFCDPCTPLLEPPQLRFLPLPADCELDGYVTFDPRVGALMEQRRCLRPSEGKLRFVEIHGLSYNVFDDVDPDNINATLWMWTLDEPEDPDPWTFEYEVAFAEIWDDNTYADAGLLPGKVPHVALVDPNDHHVVYFLQGSKIFGLNAREKKIVACEECLPDLQQMSSISRPFIDAWELPANVATTTLLDTVCAVVCCSVLSSNALPTVTEHVVWLLEIST
jgi:hypothetical protein